MCSHFLFSVVVTSLEQIVPSCYKVDDGNRLITSCSNNTTTYTIHNTSLRACCDLVNNLFTLLHLLEQLVASLLAPSILLRVIICPGLANTTENKQDKRILSKSSRFLRVQQKSCRVRLIFSQHEKKEKEIREEFENEMAMKEKQLQELLSQQREVSKYPCENISSVSMTCLHPFAI